jgi:hypothetical protein
MRPKNHIFHIPAPILACAPTALLFAMADLKQIPGALKRKRQ